MLVSHTFDKMLLVHEFFVLHACASLGWTKTFILSEISGRGPALERSAGHGRSGWSSGRRRCGAQTLATSVKSVSYLTTAFSFASISLEGAASDLVHTRQAARQRDGLDQENRKHKKAAPATDNNASSCNS